MNLGLNTKLTALVEELKIKHPHLRPRHISEIFCALLEGISREKIEKAAAEYTPESEILKAAMKDDSLKKEFRKIFMKAKSKQAS